MIKINDVMFGMFYDFHNFLHKIHFERRRKPKKKNSIRKSSWRVLEPKTSRKKNDGNRKKIEI